MARVRGPIKPGFPRSGAVAAPVKHGLGELVPPASSVNPIAPAIAAHPDVNIHPSQLGQAHGMFPQTQGLGDLTPLPPGSGA